MRAFSRFKKCKIGCFTLNNLSCLKKYRNKLYDILVLYIEVKIENLILCYEQTNEVFCHIIRYIFTSFNCRN